MSTNYLKYYNGEEPTAVEQTEAENLQDALTAVENLIKQNPDIGLYIQDIVDHYKVAA